MSAKSRLPPEAPGGADRWRADLRFLLFSALAAVAFGIVHDSVDVHISPDFYRIFKPAPDTLSVALWSVGVGAISAW